MKIIIPVKTLKAHQLVKGVRETNLALNGIYITPDRIISSDNKMILVSENKLNPQMRAPYLVKIDRIPAGVSMAVIDTDLQLCYFLDRIINQSMLKDIDLTEQFKCVTGARVMRYDYPDILPKLVIKPGRIGTLKISAHIMSKISMVTKAIGSKSGEVELSFQAEKGAVVNALIRQGATVLNLYFKPMI